MTLNRTTPRKHVEWSLLLNTFVEIRFHGQVIRTGFVEDAMPDSSALWIAADHDGPRLMFEASQGHQVWVTPQELSGELNYRMTTKQIFGTSTDKRTKARGAGLVCWIDSGRARRRYPTAVIRAVS